MAKKTYSFEFIIAVLKQGEAGATAIELHRQHGISPASFFTWRMKFSGMDVAMMEERKKHLLVEALLRRKQANADNKDRALNELNKPSEVARTLLPSAVQKAIKRWKASVRSHTTIEKQKIISLKAIQGIAHAWGGECLSADYVNLLTRVSIRCAKGHYWQCKPSHLITGKFCLICAKDEQKQRDLENIKKIAVARGWQCLTIEYKGCKSAVAWRCKNGHEFTVRPDSISAGFGCMQCFKDRRQKTLAKMQDLAKARGGVCLSERYDAYERLLWQCQRGHRWKAHSRDICRGHWCQQCSSIEKITRSGSPAWIKYGSI
ncbi:transposase [Janthinobacterium sp. B9-8]|uniref:transposase n=1 Tax=Janthinobacterium sp. B9-8 TaxID=1236179 RepID=UPI00061D08A6|nr:transposase [Janthinobacterium sp. B9-8]AMC36615.1 hypothetical protein VN23_19475 [Janthinobacterium sp. B9-8]